MNLKRLRMKKIFRMNKRGDEAEPRTAAVPMAIAGFVLVIIILGLIIWFRGGGGESFFRNLPGFNQTKPAVVDLEIFRYSALDQKIQFYDSTKWVNLNSGTIIEANEKKIKYDDLDFWLRLKFIDLIRKEGVDKAISRGESVPEINIDAVNALSLDIRFNRNSGRWEYETILKWHDFSDKTTLALEFTNFYDTLGNELSPSSIDEAAGYRTIARLKNTFRGDLESVTGVPYGWFDSYVNEQVTINYKDRDDNPQKITTCFIKDYYRAPDWALVIDLTRPLAAGEKCPY